MQNFRRNCYDNKGEPTQKNQGRKIMTAKMLSAICTFQCMKFDWMWRRMERDRDMTNTNCPAYHIHFRACNFISKKSTYWEEHDPESCIKSYVLVFQNIQAENYWIVFAHIDLINYLYKALKLLRQTQQKLDKSMCCNSHSGADAPGTQGTVPDCASHKPSQCRQPGARLSPLYQYVTLY